MKNQCVTGFYCLWLTLNHQFQRLVDVEPAGGGTGTPAKAIGTLNATNVRGAIRAETLKKQTKKTNKRQNNNNKNTINKTKNHQQRTV